MKILKLVAPQQSLATAGTPYESLEKVETWLSVLPRAKADQAAQELLNFLTTMNRSAIRADLRYSMLDAASTILNELVTTLTKKYANSTFPLAHANKKSSRMVRDLLTELANGYKMVALTLSQQEVSHDSQVNLVNALHAAMDTLSRLLIANYEIYAPHPDGIWFEINQIYKYAEDMHILNTPQSRSGSHPHQTIAQGYHRIALTALAEPNHLMQGECSFIFSELRNWTTGCKIERLHEQGNPHGKLCVDLNSDMHPRYFPAQIALPPAADYRMLDISALLTLVETRKRELLQTLKSADGSRTTLAERRMRDTFNHLTMAWSTRAERQFTRIPMDMQIDFVLGINECHAVYSEGKSFTPEEDDLKLRPGLEGISPGFDLSLISEHQTPWIYEDEVRKLRAGIIGNHFSTFSSEGNRDGDDTWGKVYQHTLDDPEKSQPIPVVKALICDQHDASRDGISLHCPAEEIIKLRVGEVISFNAGESSRHEDWFIGSVRWLLNTKDNKIEFGVKKLADSALAVAARGIKGVGAGGEYVRALLIPRLDPIQYATTLITPAAIYDVNSYLLVNTGNQLFYVQLKKLLESTGSYARYQFLIAESPSQTTQTQV